MYRRLLRNLFILALVVAVFAAVALYIQRETITKNNQIYDNQVTIAIETAIRNALYDATRAAEVPLPQYRLILLDDDDTLGDIAARYNTTVEVLRMANGLAPDVVSGAGSEIIVPEGVLLLDPPRRLSLLEAQPGDTLEGIAQRRQIPIEVLVLDNPVLAQRQLIPGDIVFVPTIL